MRINWYLYGRRTSVYKCNRCASHVGTRYHCTECNDFDLCFTCNKKVKHPHIMEKVYVQLYDSWFFRSSVLRGYQEQAEVPNSNKLSKSILSLLKHSAKCRRCNLPDCINIKRVISHGRKCKFKNDGKCPIYTKYFEILKCHCTVHCTKGDFHCPSVHF